MQINKKNGVDHWDEIKKIGFDYACDDINPNKFKYKTIDEKNAFLKGYEEGLVKMNSMNFVEERQEDPRFNQ